MIVVVVFGGRKKLRSSLVYYDQGFESRPYRHLEKFELPRDPPTCGTYRLREIFFTFPVLPLNLATDAGGRIHIGKLSEGGFLCLPSTTVLFCSTLRGIMTLVKSLSAPATFWF